MSKKQKHLSLLLGGTLLSSCEIFGNISDNVATTSDERAHSSTSAAVNTQRQATQNTVREILNTLQKFSQKSDLEKATFVDVFSAIILSAYNASDVLQVTTDNSLPTLVKEVSDKIATSLTIILTSNKAEEIWKDSVSVGGPQDHLLYKSAQFKLEFYANLTLQHMNSSDPVATTPAMPEQETIPKAKAAPITQLVYAGQDLSQYPDLVSLSITVAQLRAGTDITSTKSLEIIVTGDAGNASLNTQRLVMPNAKIDMSAVTNLTEAIVARADTTSVKLPASVTTLTIPSTVTSVSGVTGLTRINLTGDATTVPTWATNGSKTDANAKLDLSAMTRLGPTLDLRGLSADITNVILPESVTKIEGLPRTVTHLTANVSAFESIGAYNTAWDATSTFPTHITHVTIVDSTTTAIANWFLCNCPNIISIDLSGLTALQTIGGGVFSFCTNLTNVDLSRLTALETIGDWFFCGCTKLTNVNLSGLTKVTSIGDRFFQDCTSLTSANLSGLTAVTTIDRWFFNNTPNLVTLTAKENSGANGTLSSATVDAITGQIANKFTLINLTGDATTVPTWVNNPSMTKDTGATLDLSAMTRLGPTLDLRGLSTDITNVILPESVTKIEGLPRTVTHLTANVSAFKSIGADKNNNSFPTHITHVTIVDSTTTSTGAMFFHNCVSLTSADLSELKAVTSIGSWFFDGCTGLTSVNLSGLTKVTSIENGFFQKCTMLTTANLSGLTAVTSIGNWFFWNTPVLVTLTAKANSGANGTLSTATVTAMPANKFTLINLTGNDTSLPDWVNNTSVTAANATLDLSAMTRLGTTLDLSSISLDITGLVINAEVQPTGINNRFVSLKLTGDATTVPAWATNGALTAANATLDLSAMTGLGPTLDLRGLSADITNVILPESVTNIESLPTTVTHLTANVSAFESIGAYTATLGATSGFPTHITHVTIVDSTTTTIGENFFSYCTKLTNVNLSGLTAVQKIGGWFFDNCTGLTNVNLSGLTNVTLILNNFFSECAGLTSVDLSGLTKVKTIGWSFFYNCTKLTDVDLSGLTAVQTIGPDFFWNTPALVTLTAKANSGANGTLSSTTVDAITVQMTDKFTLINLTGNDTSLPDWVNNTSVTAANAKLDLSAMTGLGGSFDFITIKNLEIKTLSLPVGVTATNTAGWTKTAGTTTWTRP